MSEIALDVLDEENAAYTLIIDGMDAASFEDLCRRSAAVNGFEQSDDTEFRFRVEGVLYVWDRSGDEVELTVALPDIAALRRSLEAFIAQVKAVEDQAVFRFLFSVDYDRELGRA